MATSDGDAADGGAAQEEDAQRTSEGEPLPLPPRTAEWHRWLHHLPWAPRLALLALGLAPLLVVYYLFWLRLGYGADIEWMEGAVLVHGKRVLDGQPLYGPPTVDFASFLYTPLHAWILAALGKVFGLSYLLGRALSILAFTALLGFVVRAALRAGAPLFSHSDGPSSAQMDPGPRRLWGRLFSLRDIRGASAEALVFSVVALGIIAAAYDFTGGWYDLVRADTLGMALSASGLYVLGVHGRNFKGVLIAGTLLGLAFFAKQTAVFFILAAGLAMPLVRLRYLPVLVGVVGLVAGLGTLALNHSTDGWLWFYIYELHQSHLTDPAQIWPKTPAILWAHGRFLYAGCAAALVLWVGAAIWRRRLLYQAPVWLLAALAGLWAAAVGRATQWSHENAYIPAVVFPAAFLAIASAEARALFTQPCSSDKGLPTTGWRAYLATHPRLRAALPWIPIALGAVHLLVTGLPDRRRHAPTPAAFAQVAELRRTLGELGRSGEIYVPYHPFYSVLAGGSGHGHTMNINDVDVTRPRAAGGKGKRKGLFGDPEDRRRRVVSARRDLLGSVRQALASGRFAYVIHDRPVISGYRPSGDQARPVVDWRYAAQIPGLVDNYRLERDLTWDRASPATLTGNLCAPRYLWVRVAPPRLPPGARVVFDFEGSSHEGWIVEGSAFGKGPVSGPLWDPRRRAAQGLVSGAGGKRWVSSFHGGDAARGRLVSPPFRLDRPQLWLRVSGGRDPEALRVSLLVDGRPVASATGLESERLRTLSWDVSAHQGKEATLEVVDEATGSWGHLQIDEVWLVPGGKSP